MAAIKIYSYSTPVGLQLARKAADQGRVAVYLGLNLNRCGCRVCESRVGGFGFYGLGPPALILGLARISALPVIPNVMGRGGAESLRACTGRYHAPRSSMPQHVWEARSIARNLATGSEQKSSMNSSSPIHLFR
jgi:hypothetical protein